MENNLERARRNALDKVRIIAQTNVCESNYIKDLQSAIEHDLLSGFSLRAINKLRPADYSNLPDIVSPQYVQSALHSYDDVSLGEEMLIIAEVLQNINTHPQTEIDF